MLFVKARPPAIPAITMPKAYTHFQTVPMSEDWALCVAFFAGISFHLLSDEWMNDN
jgi:hypothetical protein